MKTLIVVLWVLPSLLMAQVHIKNQRFLQLNLGAYDSFLPKRGSFSGSLEWGKYNKKLNSRILGIAINHKNVFVFSDETKLSLDLEIPVNQYFAFYKSDITLYRNATKVFHIKGTGQVNLGYESINRESKYANAYTLSKTSEYLVGVGAGLQIEYCPFVFGVTENINFLSKYQKLSTLPHLGFRIHFY